MPHAIFKYPLEIPLTDIEMPGGAELLHVHDQHGEPTLWALVDTLEPLRTRQILTVGTGWPTELSTMAGGTIPYVGTAHCRGFVWHVFDAGWAP